MDNFEDFAHALTRWSFGVTVLVGLVASEFSGAETVTGVVLAAFSSFLSAICGTASNPPEEQFRRKKYSNILYFFIIWLDVLTYLGAAATCARLASATVDYISKGHFRDFLFGLESHSLGEPWPDVLGVTIIVVVTILFMLGLENSYTISSILLTTVISSFIFLISVGCFHTIVKFWKIYESFKIHSLRAVLTASAICSFGFVNKMPRAHKKICPLFAIVFNPLIFYISTAVIFMLMSHYRELAGTAIPLIRIFEMRDVDWARPVMAVCTICVVCLALTEILPFIYSSFVKLASKDWQIFLSSMQYQSSLSGAPVLAIFAAGSLAAILAFACPLSHLIKLLNTSNLMKCIVNSSQLLCSRYKPEVYHNESLVHRTNVQYSKLKKNNTKQIPKQSLCDRFRSIFGVRISNYISTNGVPKSATCNLLNKTEERECLLLDDYSNKSVNIGLSEDSTSEIDENELGSGSEADDSGSSTDIDVIVQEYQERLQVATINKFTEKRPSTVITFSTVIVCLTITMVASVSASLYVLKILYILWPSLVAVSASLLIVTAMPQNSADKAKYGNVHFYIFPTCLIISIFINIVIASMLINDIWQGILFWILAGMFLFLRCECCSCDDLMHSGRTSAKVGHMDIDDSMYACKYNSADTIYITR